MTVSQHPFGDTLAKSAILTIASYILRIYPSRQEGLPWQYVCLLRLFVIVWPFLPRPLTRKRNTNDPSFFRIIPHPGTISNN